MSRSQRSIGGWLAYIPIPIILLILISKDITFYAQLPSEYLVLLTLAIIVALNPIRHHYTYYSFIGGLSLVTYVVSGLLPEILLTSIATIVLVLRSDMKWDQHYVYPLYLTTLTGVSVLSAGSYQFMRYLFTNNQFPGYQLIPIATYMAVQFLSTYLLSEIGTKIYMQEEHRLLAERFRFSFFLGIVIVPFVFAMLYMHLGLGTTGLFIVGIPYFIVAIGFKYYYRLYNFQELLLEINRYLQELSNSTNVPVVLERFVRKLAKLFPVGQIACAERNETGDLVVTKIYEHNQGFRSPKEAIILKKGSPVAQAIRSREMMVFSKAEDWQSKPLYEGDYHPESLVTLPISIMAEEKCVLMLTHPHQSVYDTFFVSLIQIFYKYIEVILNNAYHFEMLTKSNLTDFLTNLPNFRGFTSHFNQVIEDGDFEFLSMIILDLDYFKKINDKHGHEAGNEVLRGIASLLNKCEDEDLFVARYGGEEFVILLKDIGRQKAFKIAEQIRRDIESHTCEITQSIQTDDIVHLKVTASIGVATYPDNCSDVYDLVRLADDTMYTKSKQGGRNRVSEYQGHEIFNLN